MSKLSVSEARKSLAEAVGKVQFGGERIIIEKHGKPVAGLVSADDLQLLEDLEDKALAIMAEEALEEHRRDPVTYTHEEVFAEMDAEDDL
ncbi:MAG: type II toxin-antitoxin system Phd/YefM family antitoxin [Pseudomonadota bacterium]